MDMILTLRIAAGAADYASFFVPQRSPAIRAYTHDIAELILYHRMRGVTLHLLFLVMHLAIS